jgi:CYRIA/CYRIB Rac1 binding domain
VLPQILSEICSGEMIPTQHLETQQALVKQFAEILEFVLKFDENKVRL